MNCLAGLYRQDSGIIYVNGESKTSLLHAMHYCSIGMVHQNFLFGFHPNLVTENITRVDAPRSDLTVK